MAINLTVEEMREVSLAIAAYQHALEQRNGSGAITETLHCLETARNKIAREWEKAEGVRTHSGSGF